MDEETLSRASEPFFSTKGVGLSTADILTDLGYSVSEAGSAEEALQLVEGGFAPDVLITDHLMPGLTGTQLTGRIRDQLPKTIVFIIFGFAEVDGIAPDVPHLTKPIRESDLARMLQRITNGAITFPQA